MKSPDVIVDRRRLCRSERGRRACRARSACAVLEAKARAGRAGTSFNDPQTGERVDNGQHVLLGCYHETFGSSDDRHRGSRAAAAESRRRVRRSPRSSEPRLGAIAAGAVQSARRAVRWEALGWRDRVSALGHGAADSHRAGRAESREPGHRAARIAASPGETVEEWLINNGQTARLREMLWEPLALAALNQSMRDAAAPPFARVLAQMFGGGPRDASLGSASLSARRAVRGTGAALHRGARRGSADRMLPATRASGEWCAGARRGAGRALDGAGVGVCAVPWHALPICLPATRRRSTFCGRRAAATSASPIVTVNLWLDRPILGRAVSRSARAGRCSGCSTSASLRRRHVASVARVERRRRVLWRANEELVALALRELREALPRCARSRGCCARRWSASGGRRSRWRPGSRRGPARDRRPRSVSGGRLDRDRPARDDRGRARSAAGWPAEARLMNSVVVHYQEIALKGRTGRGSSAGSCATSEPRRAISTCNASSRRWAASRSCSVRRSAWEPVADRLRHVFGIANFSRAGRAPLDVDAIAHGHSQRPRRPAGADVPRVRPARRQALSPDVAANRARGRRPHQGGAGWTVNLDEPDFTIHVER